MMTTVNHNSNFKITLKDAKDILKTEVNEYRVSGYPYLDKADIPKVNDFKEFYVDSDEVHLALIGRKLAADQNVVWGTGTHTSTPVAVIAYGPGSSSFGKFLHHVEVGQLMIEALTGVSIE